MPGVRGWRDGNPGLAHVAAVITSTLAAASHDASVRLSVHWSTNVRPELGTAANVSTQVARSGRRERRAALLRRIQAASASVSRTEGARALTKPK
jgi:hypothetical protein